MMSKSTVSKIALCLSAVLFAFSLYTYSTLGYGGVMLIMALLLNNTSVGGALCFGALSFGGKTKNVFCGVYIVNLALFIIMNIIALCAAVGSAAVKVSYIGLLQIPALLAVLVLLFCGFYLPEKLPKRTEVIISSAVTLIYIILMVYEFTKTASDMNLTICTVIGYIQMCAVYWYPSAE